MSEEMGRLGWLKWRESIKTDPSLWTVKNDGSGDRFKVLAPQPDDPAYGVFISVIPGLDNTFDWGMGSVSPGDGRPEFDFEQHGEAGTMSAALIYLAHTLGYTALVPLYNGPGSLER